LFTKEFFILPAVYFRIILSIPVPVSGRVVRYRQISPCTTPFSYLTFRKTP